MWGELANSRGGRGVVHPEGGARLRWRGGDRGETTGPRGPAGLAATSSTRAEMRRADCAPRLDGTPASLG